MSASAKKKCYLSATKLVLNVSLTRNFIYILFFSFSAKKTHHQSATKLVTPVAYPFTLLKPCGVQGDVTLNDINQRILMPQLRLTYRHHGKYYDTALQSASSMTFSGKAIVSLTTFHTEGKGSITIMRTKG